MLEIENYKTINGNIDQQFATHFPTCNGMGLIPFLDGRLIACKRVYDGKEYLQIGFGDRFDQNSDFAHQFWEKIVRDYLFLTPIRHHEVMQSNDGYVIHFDTEHRYATAGLHINDPFLIDNQKQLLAVINRIQQLLAPIGSRFYESEENAENKLDIIQREARVTRVGLEQLAQQGSFYNEIYEMIARLDLFLHCRTLEQVKAVLPKQSKAHTIGLWDPAAATLTSYNFDQAGNIVEEVEPLPHIELLNEKATQFFLHLKQHERLLH